MKFTTAFFALLYLSSLALARVAPIRFGPAPSDVTPSSYASPDLEKVWAPINGPSCTRTTPPKFTRANFFPSEYEDDQYVLSVEVDWCDGPDDKLRFRVMENEGPFYMPVTRVLSAEVRDYPTFYSGIVRTGCKSKFIYLEACARPKKQAKALCATSQVYYVSPGPVPEPRLKYRPPIKLELAPGDSAKIVTEIVNATGRGPLGNGGNDHARNAFSLSSVVTSQYNKELVKTAPKETSTSAATLSATGTSGKTRKFYNGATAFVEYSLASCLSSTASTKSRYGTAIAVTKNIKSLVKQDTKIPTIEQPVFEPIRSGNSATITVKAENVGGGVRAGGVPTKLHYQWYLRSEDFSSYSTYAEPIKGATGNTLKLDKVTCEGPNYSRNIVSGLKEYYVDVCNTFGCARSEKIVPKYIDDDGSIISDDDCF